MTVIGPSQPSGIHALRNRNRSFPVVNRRITRSTLSGPFHHCSLLNRCQALSNIVSHYSKNSCHESSNVVSGTQSFAFYQKISQNLTRVLQIHGVRHWVDLATFAYISCQWGGVKRSQPLSAIVNVRSLVYRTGDRDQEPKRTAIALSVPRVPRAPSRFISRLDSPQ